MTGTALARVFDASSPSCVSSGSANMAASSVRGEAWPMGFTDNPSPWADETVGMPAEPRIILASPLSSLLPRTFLPPQRRVISPTRGFRTVTQQRSVSGTDNWRDRVFLRSPTVRPTRLVCQPLASNSRCAACSVQQDWWPTESAGLPVWWWGRMVVLNSKASGHPNTKTPWVVPHVNL